MRYLIVILAVVLCYGSVFAGTIKGDVSTIETSGVVGEIEKVQVEKTFTTKAVIPGAVTNGLADFNMRVTTKAGAEVYKDPAANYSVGCKDCGLLHQCMPSKYFKSADGDSCATFCTTETLKPACDSVVCAARCEACFSATTCKSQNRYQARKYELITTTDKNIANTVYTSGSVTKIWIHADYTSYYVEYSGGTQSSDNVGFKFQALADGDETDGVAVSAFYNITDGTLFGKVEVVP